MILQGAKFFVCMFYGKNSDWPDLWQSAMMQFKDVNC